MYEVSDMSMQRLNNFIHKFIIPKVYSFIIVTFITIQHVHSITLTVIHIIRNFGPFHPTISHF